MSGLLVTIGKRGSFGYIAQEGEIELFSLEEICYYLYHNIYRITKDFFHTELLLYLKEELQLEKLVGQLDELLKTEAPFEDLVMTIMRYANYYDTEELETFQEKLFRFRNLSKEEKRKLMGDNCLQEEKEKEAIFHYDKALNYQKNSSMNKEFWGKIYHNMGVCYIHMLFYEEAAKHLEKAYQILQSEAVAKELLFVWYLSGKEEKYQNCAKGFAQETWEAWEKEWEEKKEEQQALEEITEILNSYQEGDVGQYRDRVKNKIEQWKQEYRNNML